MKNGIMIQHSELKMSKKPLHTIPDAEGIRSQRIDAPDVSEYSATDGQRTAGPAVLAPVTAHQLQQPGEIIEMIRDPHDPKRAVFLRCADGGCSLHSRLDRDGKIFVLPALPLNPLLAPAFPSGLCECGTPANLFAELLAVLQFRPGTPHI